MKDQKLKSHIFQNLKIIVLALLLVVGTQYVAAVDWRAPAGSPPNNNTSAPINVGVDGQSKLGGVTLGAGMSASGLSLNVPFGNVQFQLGDANPTGKVLKAKDANGTLEWATDGSGGGSSNTVSYVADPRNNTRTAVTEGFPSNGSFISVPAPSVLSVSCPDNQVLTGLYLQQDNAGPRYEVVGVKCAALQTP